MNSEEVDVLHEEESPIIPILYRERASDFKKVMHKQSRNLIFLRLS